MHKPYFLKIEIQLKQQSTHRSACLGAITRLGCTSQWVGDQDSSRIGFLKASPRHPGNPSQLHSGNLRLDKTSDKQHRVAIPKSAIPLTHNDIIILNAQLAASTES